MAGIKNSGTSRVRRHERVRKKVSGTGERPRLSVFRSLNQIYAQVIDDDLGQTVVAASSLDAEIKAKPGEKKKKKQDLAGLVGTLVAKRAQDKGVTQVVFDRGGYRYHGRVKALAEAARKAGLRF